MFLTYYFYLWIYSLTFYGANGIFMPRSCLEVTTSGSKNNTDDSYVIFLSNNVGVPIYCKGKICINYLPAYMHRGLLRIMFIPRQLKVLTCKNRTRCSSLRGEFEKYYASSAWDGPFKY